MLDGIARRARSGATQRPSSWRNAPSSISIEIISSTNSGFPSAAVWTRANASGVDVPPPSSPSTSCADSLSDSGSRKMAVALCLPPPHAGRASSRSGRAIATSRIGASRDQSAMCSTRSSSVGSAQLRSSNTTTSGCWRASASSKWRTPQKPSSTAADVSASPTSSATRAATSSASASRGKRPTRASPRASAGESSVGDLGQLLDDLQHRPERDALAVGQAGPGQHARAIADSGEGFRDEP